MQFPLRCVATLFSLGGLFVSGCSWRGQQYSDFDPVPAPNSAPTLVLGFLGGRDSWNEERVGVGKLARRLRQALPPTARVYTVEKLKRHLALRLVRESLDRNGNGVLDPAERESAQIILFGQSFGGAAVVKFARQLHAIEVPVLLTVQIDSVGVGDAVIPPNVLHAANLYQRNGLIIRGEQCIRATDPTRTKIIYNRRFDYRGRNISLTHLPWHKRLLRNDHMRMDSDPEVWNEVERLIRSTLEEHSSTNAGSIVR